MASAFIVIGMTLPPTHAGRPERYPMRGPVRPKQECADAERWSGQTLSAGEKFGQAYKVTKLSHAALVAEVQAAGIADGRERALAWKPCQKRSFQHPGGDKSLVFRVSV